VEHFRRRLGGGPCGGIGGGFLKRVGFLDIGGGAWWFRLLRQSRARTEGGGQEGQQDPATIEWFLLHNGITLASSGDRRVNATQ
jgi:hypothetical protein